MNIDTDVVQSHYLERLAPKGNEKDQYRDMAEVRCIAPDCPLADGQLTTFEEILMNSGIDRTLQSMLSRKDIWISSLRIAKELDRLGHF